MKKKTKMRKAELREIINRQENAAKNTMDIFKVLAEGGEIVVYFFRDKEPSYDVRSKDRKMSSFEICSRNIFMGLYARGLLVVTDEIVKEDFSAQHYVLRIPKEK